MQQSHVIEADGVFLGAAVRQGSVFRFVAVHARVSMLDGSVCASLAEADRAARTLFRNQRPVQDTGE